MDEQRDSFGPVYNLDGPPAQRLIGKERRFGCGWLAALGVAVLVLAVLAFSGMLSIQGADFEGMEFEFEEVRSGMSPDLVGEDLNGDRFDLRDFRGERIVIVWWNSRCVPCVEQLQLVQAAADLNEPDVRYVTVVDEDDFWEDSDRVREVARELNLSVPVVFANNQQGPGMRQIWSSLSSSRTGGSVVYSGVPLYFVIDRDGTVESKTTYLPPATKAEG